MKTEAHGPLFSRLPPDLVNKEEEYKIETVLTHKGQSEKRTYLVK